MKKEKQYYLYQGEEVIATGTIKEISKKMNITENTLKFYKNPAYIRTRGGKNARVLVCAEED